MTSRDRQGRKQRMSAVAAFEILAEITNAEQVVVTNQGSARIFPGLRRRALDFHYNPSTMSGAIPLALGLAIAQPNREVLVVSGDGSLLMSLGTLVTAISVNVANFTVVLVDNSIYEVTGGQRTPAPAVLDYCGVARAVGFSSVASFEEIAGWRAQATEALNAPGPRFIRLAVEPVPDIYLRSPTPPIAAQLDELRRALGVTSV